MKQFLLSGRHLGFGLLALGCVTALSACGGGGGGTQVPTATPIVTATPGGTPLPTTPVPAGLGLLVFAAPAEGADPAQTDIFSIRPDGSGLTRLTMSTVAADGNVQPQGSPALSPNRAQIVYVSVSSTGGQTQSQLRIMNADGSNNRALSGTRFDDATVPTWSPDGTRIAFSQGNNGIYTVNADGTGFRQLTSSGANPSWSINNQIAFNAPPGVRVVSTTLRSAPSKRGTRAVLPPGTSVYNDIWVVGAEGSNLRQLTQQSQNETGLANINPAWNPAGTTLVFNSVPGSGISAQLFLINADGSNRRRLGSLEGTDPVWSPSGSQIAYSSENGLSVANADGTNSRIVNANAELFVEDTDWR